jgi:hypothetical protein
MWLKPLSCFCSCLAAVAFAPPSSHAAALTFEKRVAAQEAVDRIYYSLQLGTKLPFEEAVPTGVIESKVRNYLKQSIALEEYWSTPVVAELLQREMERIAARSSRPDKLQEIYEALGNDPILIRECFVRPILVDRLARGLFARDETIHGSALREATTIARQLQTGALDPRGEHARRRVVDLVWPDESRSVERGLPSPEGSRVPIALGAREYAHWRALAPARIGDVGTVREERGTFSVRVVLAEGRRWVRLAEYVVPRTAWDDWWPKAAEELDENRVREVAVTTSVPSAFDTSHGLSCMPGDSWEPISNSLAPPGGGAAVWTGIHMVVWGGGADRNEGGRYDPITDAWSPTSTVNAPQGRVLHTSVWTGAEMMVWGGIDGTGVTAAMNSGGRYDPLSDTWLPMAPAPRGQRGHTAVWTGTEMIVWGGTVEPVFPFGGTPEGARYDPASDTWSSTALTGSPSGRYDHTAVWTGNEMIVWGGTFQSCCEPPVFPHTGGRYDPATDSWQPTSASDAPLGRTGHTAVWTGDQMVLWGGSTPGSGARYDPLADVWTDLPTGGPAGRSEGAWLAPYVVTLSFSSTLGFDGGLYDPQLNQWVPMTLTNAPQTSSNVVGATTFLLVWSGHSGGARYSFGDPDGDGLCASDDNCALIHNMDQADSDDDGLGEPCDACPIDSQNDADADGVCADADICPFIFNPDQRRVPFGQMLIAADRNSLLWTIPVDVDFVRGDLRGVSNYALTENGSLTGATSLDVTVDGASPGEGFYYLVKLAGDCGSWETAPDAEPARNVALP